jgi:hypothetical protein
MAQGVEINKKRLRLSRLRIGTAFVELRLLFHAMIQGGRKHMFWLPFFVSFLWRDKEMKRKKLF